MVIVQITKKNDAEVTISKQIWSEVVAMITIKTRACVCAFLPPAHFCTKNASAHKR